MGAKRGYGTGQLHVKHGAYYGRWRTSDSRRLNRRLGPVREVGNSDGLTRAEAERVFRREQDREEQQPRPATVASRVTVDQATDDLRRRLAIQGSRKSYLEGCHSMQRVHITPRLGDRPIAKITTTDIEDVGAAMLADGLKPKTVRNLLTFLHQVFEHANDRGWTRDNPVRKASRPRRNAPATSNPTSSSSTSPNSKPSYEPSPTTSCVGSPRRRGADDPAPRHPRRPTSWDQYSASSSSPLR